MVQRQDPVAASSYQTRDDHTLLVLQGGGALGAYQAGVYEALSETGFAPDWVDGRLDRRDQRGAHRGQPAGASRGEAARVLGSRVVGHAARSARGVRPAALRAESRLGARRARRSAFRASSLRASRRSPSRPKGASRRCRIYDTTPLRETLDELVDFDLINDKTMRFSVGVGPGAHRQLEVFRQLRGRDPIRAEHVMASGALPPGFPPVEIDGEFYWDGGLVSNTPLWYVLDDSPAPRSVDHAGRSVQRARRDAVQSRRGDGARRRTSVYSSKTRFNTNHVKEIEELGAALRRVLAKLPPRVRGGSPT